MNRRECLPVQVVRMEGLREFLSDVKRHGYAQDNLLGMFHVLIGRRIATADGVVISEGLNWRALADLLKRVRWDKEVVRQLGLSPSNLPPRDRQRYWYHAISHAQVDSEAAKQAGRAFADRLRKAGYQIGEGH